MESLGYIAEVDQDPSLLLLVLEPEGTSKIRGDVREWGRRSETLWVQLANLLLDMLPLSFLQSASWTGFRYLKSQIVGLEDESMLTSSSNYV